jgi:hypothetical protein
VSTISLLKRLVRENRTSGFSHGVLGYWLSYCDGLLQMFERRTIKVLFLIAVAYAVLWVPYVVWQGSLPAYLTAPYAVLGLVHTIPVYILNGIGIPGLLQNNGYCGWGWCGPTVFGYVVLAAFWTVVAWLVAWLISNLTSTVKGRS